MLFLLDKDVRTVKWNGIPLHETSSAIVKEETNGDFYLTVRYPITDSDIYQLIKEDMLIKAPTPVLGPQLFRIKKPIENDDSLNITAYHISDDVMQRSVKPVSVVGQNCAMALSQMVQNTKSDIGDFSFTSDIMDSRTFNTTETETLYSVLMNGKHSIVGTWEGELVRDNFALSIKRSRGADRGVVITTHKNLNSYQRTKNSQVVVTRIHARSTFKPDGSKDEVTLKVTVDSPLINSYPYINEKEYENNNAKTVEDLRKWAESKFTNEGIDKVSDTIEIEAYELDGQVVHLGDTINLKSKKHSADLYKKAIAYEFNALTEEYISITFDDKSGVGGSGLSSGLSNAADAILGASETAQDVAIQRAVKNANAAFDAEFDKRETIILDSIEQAKSNAELYADNIRNEIQGEFKTHQNQYQFDRQEQDSKIAEILEKTNANTDLATEAKIIGTQAKTDAIAEANRLVESAKTLLSGQVSNVSTDLAKTNDSIKLLASKQSIEDLSGKLSSTEASLQLQAGKIEQRLTATQVEQVISSKGFATMSSVQNLVNETADSFSRTISQTTSQLSTITTKFNDVNDTVSSHTRTIAEQDKSLSQIIQTSQGLISRVGDLVDGRNIIYGATKLPKYISSVATDTHLQRVGWGDHDGIRINYTQSMSGWLGFRLPLSKKFVRAGDRLAYRIEIAVDVIPENNMVLIQLLDNTSSLGMYYNSSITITSTGNHVFTGFIDIPKTGELNEYSLRFTLTRPGNIVIHKPTIVESDTVPEKFFDNTDYTTEYNRTLVTQLSNSWSVQNINSAGDLISGINLGANGNNRIDGKATHITGQTLIDNAVIKSAMIDTIKTANLESGSVTTSILSSEAVTADKLKVDQALFNKLMANEAYLEQLFAKRAFITQVQSVTLSASKISGGVLTANNGNSTFNLNSGVITMQASPTSWKTTWDANGIAFRGSNNAVWGAMGGDSGGGMGIYMRGDRAFTVVLNHSDNGSTTSYTPIRFKYGEGTTLQFSPNGPSYNLLHLINDIYKNLKLLHDNKTTSSSYSYSFIGPVK